MKKFKVTEKNGASIYYQAEKELDWAAMGHGKPERWILHKDEPMATEGYEEADIAQEHGLQEVIQKRIAEYPTVNEFLNAFFDGGLNELKQKRLEIKAKYPKP